MALGWVTPPILLGCLRSSFSKFLFSGHQKEVWFIAVNMRKGTTTGTSIQHRPSHLLARISIVGAVFLGRL